MKNVPRNPTLLIIMDGVGINPNTENNAFALAKKPNLDRFFSNYPTTLLAASGRPVGLPNGQMGNSEVGHMTMGCGSILRQGLVRIDDAIEDKSFFSNREMLNAIQHAKQHARPLHLIGLVSDGGVHSHINHLLALFTLCKNNGVTPVLHAITDGRDTAPQSALEYMRSITPALKEADGEIATVTGRFYAMDRDKRWDRTKQTWRALCYGEGQRAESVEDAIHQSYAQGVYDEFIPPTVIKESGVIKNNDTALFFNFRNDRARQLSYLLGSAEFIPFDRGTFSPILITTLIEYDSKFVVPVAFKPEYPETTLSDEISKLNIQQFHCAETEKYPHVTFFFNGGIETKKTGEDRCMIPSPAISTYDKAPEMSAKEVTDAVIDAIKKNTYGFIVVNYANGDMVGHTAVRDAVITAVETLDREVGRLIDFALSKKMSIILTADHGNCDELIDAKTGEPHTQHTLNPVPCVIFDNEHWQLKPDSGLANIAPTVLTLMGLKVPSTMHSSPIITQHEQSLSPSLSTS